MVHDKATDVMLENQHPFISSGTPLKLRWSPQSVLPFEPANSFAVDIFLREYNHTSDEWVFTLIANGIPNTGYAEISAPDLGLPKSYNDSVTSAIIQIGVSETVSGLQNRKRGLLSALLGKAIKTIAKYTGITVVKKAIKDTLF